MAADLDSIGTMIHRFSLGTATTRQTSIRFSWMLLSVALS
jgi:hypothetical protein